MKKIFMIMSLLLSFPAFASSSNSPENQKEKASISEQIFDGDEWYINEIDCKAEKRDPEVLAGLALGKKAETAQKMSIDDELNWLLSKQDPYILHLCSLHYKAFSNSNSSSCAMVSSSSSISSQDKDENEIIAEQKKYGFRNDVRITKAPMPFKEYWALCRQQESKPKLPAQDKLSDLNTVSEIIQLNQPQSPSTSLSSMQTHGLHPVHWSFSAEGNLVDGGNASSSSSSTEQKKN